MILPPTSHNGTWLPPATFPARQRGAEISALEQLVRPATASPRVLGRAVARPMTARGSATQRLPQRPWTGKPPRLRPKTARPAVTGTDQSFRRLGISYGGDAVTVTGLDRLVPGGVQLSYQAEVAAEMAEFEEPTSARTPQPPPMPRPSSRQRPPRPLITLTANGGSVMCRRPSASDSLRPRSAARAVAVILPPTISPASQPRYTTLFERSGVAIKRPLPSREQLSFFFTGDATSF